MPALRAAMAWRGVIHQKGRKSLADAMMEGGGEEGEGKREEETDRRRWGIWGRLTTLIYDRRTWYEKGGWNGQRLCIGNDNPSHDRLDVLGAMQSMVTLHRLHIYVL
jgi:hypothetical protein